MSSRPLLLKRSQRRKYLCDIISAMDILVIVGGTNEPSNSHAIANAFSQGIHQLGEVHVHTRRLKDLQIAHFNLDFYDPQCSQEEDFCAIQDLIERSSGVLITTPIWNFGVPAHLKNLFDRMGSFTLDETRSKGTLNGKPVDALVTVEVEFNLHDTPALIRHARNGDAATVRVLLDSGAKINAKNKRGRLVTPERLLHPRKLFSSLRVFHGNAPQVPQNAPPRE